MSAIETYNEKVILVSDLESQILFTNNRKTELENRLTEINASIAANSTEQATVDAALVAAQANLPTDTETYKTKLFECKNCMNGLTNLNNEKTFMTNRLNDIEQRLTSLTASKTTADAELAAALAALS
jgi:chromosome segregation ATPase